MNIRAPYISVESGTRIKKASVQQSIEEEYGGIFRPKNITPTVIPADIQDIVIIL